MWSALWVLIQQFNSYAMRGPWPPRGKSLKPGLITLDPLVWWSHITICTTLVNASSALLCLIWNPDSVCNSCCTPHCISENLVSACARIKTDYDVAVVMYHTKAIVLFHHCAWLWAHLPQPYDPCDLSSINIFDVSMGQNKIIWILQNLIPVKPANQEQ